MRIQISTPKLIVSALCCCILSFTFITYTTAQCPVLVNGGFDDADPDLGWENSDLGDDPGSTSNWLSGGNSANLKTGDIIYQEVTVMPYTQYALNYSYTIDDDVFPPDNFEVLVLAGGGYGATLPISAGIVLGSFDGLLVSGKKNYFKASIKFYSGANTTISIFGEHNGVGDDVRLDEFELICPEPANCTCDDADLPTIICPSFEDGCRPWGGGDGNEFWENDSYDLSGGPSLYSGTSTANTGSQAAKFTSSGRYAYQEVHVEPNACYTVEYYVRSNSGGVLQLDIMADGNLIDPTTGTALATATHIGSTGGNYEVQTLTFTVTTECVVALFFSNPGGTSDSWVDDVTFINKECKPDIIPPMAVCPPDDITVTVDPITGIGTLLADALGGGLSSDVLPDTMPVIETSPLTMFTSADVGTQTVILTVTDACGNESTAECNVEVEAEAFIFLDSDGNGNINGIADPCMCNNDQSANGAADGTFGEVVEVFGPSGFNLVIGTGSTGMIGAAVGTPIVEIGNTGVYQVTFDHLDQVGYTLFVSAMVGGVETSLDLSISNVCQYPVITEPTIESDILCYNAEPIIFDGTEVIELSGLPGVVSVHVNSLSAPAITTFDPLLYPQGVYQLYFVFTATFENNNINLNPVPTPANPGCETFTTVFITTSDGGQVACNDHVNLSVDETCGVFPSNDLFLEGGAVGELFILQIEDGIGGFVDLDDVSAYIGQTLTYSLTNDCTGSSCWGTVTFEDKQGPVDFECEDVTINCIEYANDELPTLPIVFGPEETMNSMGFPAGGLDLLAGETIMFDLSSMIPAGAEVTDVDVIIDLTDIAGIGDTDDIDLVITSPDGTTGTFFEGLAFWAGTCFNINTTMDFILDDEAPVWGTCADLTSGGNFSMDPAEGFDMLSIFDGGAASGMWMVTMVNVFTSDAYLINNIELIITYESPILDLNELDNCGTVNFTYEDVIIPGGDCNETLINRTYIATDAQGNTNSCSSTITVEPISLVDDLGTILLLPPSTVILPCGADTDPWDIADYYDNWIDIDGDGVLDIPGPETDDCIDDSDCPNDVYENEEGVVMGFPHYVAWGCNSSCNDKTDEHFQPIDNNVCSIYAIYSDQVIDACGEGCAGNEKVIRTWTLVDWCSQEQATHVQVIKSVDLDAPEITATDATMSVNPWGCVASGELPAPEHLFDACSKDVTYTVAGPAGTQIISVNGDGLAPYGIVGAPKGEHLIVYTAIDCCGNTALATMTLSVVDDTPPTAISLENIVVSLTSGSSDEGGVAKVYATSVDNGSHDGDCGPVRVEIARADGSTACNSAFLTGGGDDNPELREGDCSIGGPILEGDLELGDANGAPAGDSRDPWRNSDLGGVIQITSSAFGGSAWAMKLPDDGSRIGYQEIPLTPNATYTIDFQYFLDDPNIGTLTVDVLAGSDYGNNKPVAGALVLGSFSDGAATSYTAGSITFNSGPFPVVSLYIHNEGVEAQIDDIELNCSGIVSPCTQGGPVMEGGVELGDANGAPSGDSRDAWRNSGLGGTIQITSAANSGNWAMKFPDDGSRIGYQEVAVSPNTNFTIDFFYFLDDPNLGTISVDILAGGGYGSANPVSGATVLGSFSDGAAVAYTYASIAFNSGNNTTVSIFISNEGVEAQLDDISINCGSTSGGGGGGGTAGVGSEFVKFCCDDIDGTLSYVGPDGQTVFYNEYDVILTVWDDGNCDGIIGNNGDNSNETWATVQVENKLPPVIVCPPDAEIGCNMDWSLHLDGPAVATEQELAMLSAPDFGTGVATGAGVCGAVSITYEDRYNEDLCFDRNGEIRREWCIEGTSICCTQDIDIVKVGSFDPNTISWNSGFPEAEIFLGCLGEDPMQEPSWLEAPCDLIAWTVATDTFYIEGNAADFGCIKVINDYTVVDWCADTEYTFTQVIKVIDDSAPTLDVPQLCVGVVDGCDAGVQLCAVAEDMGDCESPWLKWEVLVDLYGDWSYDHTFSSYVSPLDPNFGTGPNEYYVAATAPGQEMCITLPIAVPSSKYLHRAVWKVSDGCGNFTSVTETFEVVDKKAPTPYCYSVSSAPMENGSVELWACDFVISAEDNCSEVFAYTFNGPDEGFVTPESTPGWIDATGCEGQVFTCPEEGNIISVKVYTWDECYNVNICYVELTLSGCGTEGGGASRIGGSIATEFGKTVENTTVEVFSDQGEYPMSVMTDNTGTYASGDHKNAWDYSIKPSNNLDHRNGVSTLDILLIQRHILNLQSLTSPYQYIAADANDDGAITAADLVDIRKLVLEIYDEFPNNESWRFIDATQALTTANAFAFSEVIDIIALSTDMDNEDFIASKTGDVNNSVVLSATGNNAEARSGNLNMNFNGETTSEGVSVEVTSSNFRAIAGYQFTLNTNGLEFASVEAGAIDMTDDNVAVLDNSTVTMSWNTMTPVTATDEVLFTLHFVGSDVTKVGEMEITSEATLAEAYDADLSVLNVVHGENAEVEFALEQNEPNPFSTQTTIEFSLPTAGTATLTVMDVTGKFVKQITGTYAKGANTLILTKDELAASGVLYYQLESGEYSATKKMIIIE